MMLTTPDRMQAMVASLPLLLLMLPGETLGASAKAGVSGGRAANLVIATKFAEL